MGTLSDLLGGSLDPSSPSTGGTLSDLLAGIDPEEALRKQEEERKRAKLAEMQALGVTSAYSPKRSADPSLAPSPAPLDSYGAARDAVGETATNIGQALVQPGSSLVRGTDLLAKGVGEGISGLFGDSPVGQVGQSIADTYDAAARQQEQFQREQLTPTPLPGALSQAFRTGGTGAVGMAPMIGEAAMAGPGAPALFGLTSGAEEVQAASDQGATPAEALTSGTITGAANYSMFAGPGLRPIVESLTAPAAAEVLAGRKAAMEAFKQSGHAGLMGMATGLAQRAGQELLYSKKYEGTPDEQWQQAMTDATDAVNNFMTMAVGSLAPSAAGVKAGNEAARSRPVPEPAPEFVNPDTVKVSGGGEIHIGQEPLGETKNVTPGAAAPEPPPAPKRTARDAQEELVILRSELPKIVDAMNGPMKFKAKAAAKMAYEKIKSLEEEVSRLSAEEAAAPAAEPGPPLQIEQNVPIDVEARPIEEPTPPPESPKTPDPFFRAGVPPEEPKAEASPPPPQRGPVPPEALGAVAQEPSFFKGIRSLWKKTKVALTTRGYKTDFEHRQVVEKDQKVKLASTKAQDLLNAITTERTKRAKLGVTTAEDFNADWKAYLRGESKGEVIGPLARRLVDESRSIMDQQSEGLARTFERQAERIKDSEPSHAATLLERAKLFRDNIGKYLHTAHRAFTDPDWADSLAEKMPSLRTKLRALKPEQASGFEEKDQLVGMFRNAGTWETVADEMGLPDEVRNLPPKELVRAVNGSPELAASWKAWEAGNNIFRFMDDPELDAWTYDYANRDIGGRRGAGAGTADTGIYRQKNLELPDVMHEILGRFESPEEETFHTITAQARNLHHWEMFDAIRGEGLLTGRFSQTKEAGKVKVPGEASRNPLAGLYGPKEGVNALVGEPTNLPSPLKFLVNLNQIIKHNLTGRNPASGGRNFGGAMLNRFAAGNAATDLMPWNWGSLSKGKLRGGLRAQFRGIGEHANIGSGKAITEAYEKIRSDVRKNHPNLSENDVDEMSAGLLNVHQLMADTYDMISRGVIQSSYQTADFADTQKEATVTQTERGMRGATNAIDKPLGNFFSAGDAVNRVLGFKEEVARIKWHSPELSDAEARKQAAANLGDTMPTAENSISGVREIRKGVPGFITYYFEILRNYPKIAQLGAREIKEGLAEDNWKKQFSGYQRLAWMAASTVALDYAVRGVAKGVGALAKTVMNKTSDEIKDPPEGLGMLLRPVLRAYQKNSTIVPISLHKGRLLIQDTTFTDPTSVFRTVYNAAKREYKDTHSVGDSFLAATEETTRNLAQRSLGLQSWWEAQDGVTSTGRRVWEESDSPGMRFAKKMGHIVQSSAPRILTMWGPLARTARESGMGKAILDATGIAKTVEIRADRDLPDAAKKYVAERNKITGQFHSKFKPGFSASARSAELDRSMTRFDNIARDMVRVVKLGRFLELSDQEIKAIFKSNEVRLGDSESAFFKDDIEKIRERYKKDLEHDLSMYDKYGDRWEGH